MLEQQADHRTIRYRSTHNTHYGTLDSYSNRAPCDPTISRSSLLPTLNTGIMSGQYPYGSCLVTSSRSYPVSFQVSFRLRPLHDVSTIVPHVRAPKPCGLERPRRVRVSDVLPRLRGVRRRSTRGAYSVIKDRAGVAAPVPLAYAIRPINRFGVPFRGCHPCGWRSSVGVTPTIRPINRFVTRSPLSTRGRSVLSTWNH